MITWIIGLLIVVLQAVGTFLITWADYRGDALAITSLPRSVSTIR